MTIDILCNMIELPAEVVKKINEYVNERASALDEALKKQLKSRQYWGQAVEELKIRIGDDPYGFYILAELLNCACETYDEYLKIGIEDNVFIQTMKFCTRFLNDHKKSHGYYAFSWAHWFPRQLALQEFRVGELEYEFIDIEEKQINIHIPSNARMELQYIQESFVEYRKFLHKYYPEWENIILYCKSWLLSPVLKRLLPKTSNILTFQKLFEIETIDYNSMKALDWVYPGENADDLLNLSENTTLQKNMKKFLLNNGKIGVAKGKLI